MTEEHDRLVLGALEKIAHESRVRWQSMQESLAGIHQTQEEIMRVVGKISDMHYEHVSQSEERISRIERRLADCDNGRRTCEHGCAVPAE